MRKESGFSQGTSFILVILCLLYLNISCQSVSQTTDDISAEVDRYIEANLKLKQFNGSILIAKGGKVLVNKGYGMANFEHEIPCSPNTKYRLGSITKQFTAAAIMQLQEKGLLYVNDPVSNYLPDYPGGDKFTIHHLLTHTSGVPSFTDFPDYRKMMILPLSQEEIIAKFKDKPLEFEPGTKYKYSNSGYFLLGHLVEKFAQKPYDEYLKENLFDPLEMYDSGYDHNHLIIKNRAAGYRLVAGELINATYIHMNIPHGAGALYSTVEDLYKWDRALYTEKVMSKESLEKMFTPFIDNYAYGWSIGEIFKHKRISHGGGINGFVTNISRYPEDDACIIVLSNMNGSRMGQITRDLAAILFGESYDFPQEQKNDQAKSLSTP